MLECNDVPNLVEGDACPVNGVANGGKMDTKEKKRGGLVTGYPGAYQEQGRGAQLLER